MTKADFTESFKTIEMSDWYKWASPWGNSKIKITMEDIMALLNGKALYYFDGEYGTYVAFVDDIPLSKELLEIASPSGGENDG